jgi:hypothetical protein
LRPFLLILIYVMLELMDAGTTLYLYENFPSGRELNPYVDPSSWQGLLLAPVTFFVHAAFLLSVFFAEKGKHNIAAEGGLLSNAAHAAYFALYLIFTDLLAVINNLMPFIGIGTPISYVLMFMENFPGSEFQHLWMFLAVVFLVMAPVGLWIVKLIYRSKAAA